MKILTACVAGLFSVALCGSAHAGVENSVPSCYEASKIGLPVPQPQVEVFILVDQTTPFDATLQASANENAGRLIRQGSAYVVATFSSFGQGRYMQVLSAGTIEAPVDEKVRNGIGMKILRTFDECMRDQLGFGRTKAATALRTAFGGVSAGLAKSDILSALKELSSRVKQSVAQDKIVFLLSDMLENSSISSFYANHNVRSIDPAAEMKKVEAAQQFGDFGGARVFVLGAGLIQDDGKTGKDRGVYRDPKTMGRLRLFWEQYFVRSNARLIDFGAPALLSPIN
ncbi:hypothetical protein BOSP111201_09130 [Bordetella sputigena]|uniref:hypothetical protein n=1 Tax=Bordetella sputigena TaxID=1416810 RepID=UPI0039F045C0